MSKFDDWIKELSKTHDVPNAPFVVEAMKAAFIGGRESVLAQWPSDEEINNQYKGLIGSDHGYGLAVNFIKKRLMGDNE